MPDRHDAQGSLGARRRQRARRQALHAARELQLRLQRDDGQPDGPRRTVRRGAARRGGLPARPAQDPLRDEGRGALAPRLAHALQLEPLPDPRARPGELVPRCPHRRSFRLHRRRRDARARNVDLPRGDGRQVRPALARALHHRRPQYVDHQDGERQDGHDAARRLQPAAVHAPQPRHGHEGHVRGLPAAHLCGRAGGRREVPARVRRSEEEVRAPALDPARRAGAERRPRRDGLRHGVAADPVHARRARPRLRRLRRGRVERAPPTHRDLRREGEQAAQVPRLHPWRLEEAARMTSPFHFATLDWVIIGASIAISFLPALFFWRRASENTSEFFTSGRAAPWWLVGISMVATPFSTDPPNLVTNFVRERGVAANWLWWSFLLTGMMTVFFYARLWRRSGVLTDLEFYEIRYSGDAAKLLRGFRAVYLGFFFNLVIMATVNLAAAKIGNIVLGWPTGRTLLVCAVMTIFFASVSGLWGVLVTDSIQFGITVTGTFAVAYYALQQPAVGGLSGVFPKVPPKTVALLPDFGNWSVAA